MNKIEEQILKNQAAIMLGLGEIIRSGESVQHLTREMITTGDLLNPETKPTIADETEDAFSEETEVRK